MGDTTIDGNTDAFAAYNHGKAIIQTYAEHQSKNVTRSDNGAVAPGEARVSSYDLSKAPVAMHLGKITGTTFRENFSSSATTKSATYTLDMLSGTDCTLTLTTSVYAGGEVVSGAGSSCKSQDGVGFSSLTDDLTDDMRDAFDSLAAELAYNGVSVPGTAKSISNDDLKPAKMRAGRAGQPGESAHNSVSSGGSDRKK